MGLSGSTFPLVFGLILLLVALSLACIRLGRLSSDPSTFTVVAGVHPPNSVSVELTVPQRGLDETTLNTYPKIRYSEVLKKGTNSNNIDPSHYPSCSICLGDYKETDTLRLLPGCGHFYHVSCVDPWLKLHPTCPICRTSSSAKSQNSNSSMEERVIIGAV